MADAVGSVEIPVQTPNDDEAVSDPALSRILSYFQAGINAKCSTAWQEVAPTSLPAQFAFTHNPNEAVFLDRKTPALFLYRVREEPFERLAEDYDISHWTLRLLWIFPPARQEFHRIRSPFVNGLVAELKHLIELGRDPSYVLPDDPDPTAATQGTVIYRVAGVWELAWKSCTVGPGITIRVDKETRNYFGIDAQILLSERRILDLNGFPSSARSDDDAAGGLDLTLKHPDGTLVLNEAKV